MMTQHTEDTRSSAEIAYDAAAAALETLYYAYWAESFPEKQLEREIAMLINRHTVRAVRLSDPSPKPMEA